jgi:hypothetical protein
MRIKAENSLARLRAMKNKERKFVSVTDIDRDTWTECKVRQTKLVGKNPEATNRYIKLVEWANKTVKGKYSRVEGSFWFEDGRDAFKFKLKYGDPK